MDITKSVLGAICAGVLMSTADQVQAGSVTYQFFNGPSGWDPPGEGEFTLTSSLLNPPNPASPYTFDLTSAELTAAGETVLGDLTSFTFSFYGHTLTKADITNPPNGWSADFNRLTTAFSASQTFADGTFLLGTMDGRSWYAQAQSGAHVIVGEWIMTSSSPVPLPGALWLLLSGMGAVGLARSRG